ncbi:hypothetical protein I8748_27770 [Nostoc sp. CENA67]|uniref:Uncharacterized protein n=1 Tax=Amazonocrinis nigriterrae CENA67 TaxID=2794033 RepID=A0A8J7LBY1_9NOST|nr:hypothetical protein [Amazonocrinis nigriterrae]MBH8565921.1 hypothetical protein [Amazonocrinis nigriterrae CENA67]
MQTLPLELELAASQIAAQYYPHRRFKLVSKIGSNCVDIEFQGYYTEKCVTQKRSNPTDDFYRDKTIDFTVGYGYGQLSISAWWRGAILAFDYNTKSWSNEDGEDISCPYPDGEEFEQIAAELYPLLQKLVN